MLPIVPYPVINDFATKHPIIAGCILLGSTVTATIALIRCREHDNNDDDHNNPPDNPKKG